MFPWLPAKWGVDCAAVFVAAGDNTNSFHLTRGCPHLQSVPVDRIIGVVVDRELVFHLRSCQTCVSRLHKGKLQLKYVKPACFEITEPGLDGTSQVSNHMAVGYIPTRLPARNPADIADPADSDHVPTPVQVPDVVDWGPGFISGPAAP